MEMETEENGNPRLGVDDKRHLFMVLTAKVERLFYLNKFPVDSYDFALSLQTPEVEGAWRLLRAKVAHKTLSPVATISVPIGPTDGELRFMLSGYSDDEHIKFMDVDYEPMKVDNRFLYKVTEWSDRQLKLEDQMLRTIKVIKAIVHSCNTVGQYKRVSPELLGFLPAKYGKALSEYTKKSPYPAIEVEEQDIENAMGTLAFASLQPEHPDEERFTARGRPRWGTPHYALSEFPRSNSYAANDYRQLRL